MSSRRKISVRKVIQTLVTFIVAAGCTLAILSADRLQNRKKVRTVQVHIRNEKVVHFLDGEEVMNILFNNRHLNPATMTLAQLDIHQMESIARSNPWVSDAQVYVDNERNLNIFLNQRVPVVRVFESDGNSYYIDSALQAMPLSDRYAHYTPVVTNVPPLHEDSASRDVKGQILSLVRFITTHKFWNAQVSQIVMMPDKTFQLIPVLGKQRIILGDTSRMEEKFSDLFAFYQQVCNKVGWDKYERLDLRFEGQVVASPSLPWKAPVDHALSNINWVKAVMDAGPKDEKDDAADNVADGPGNPASAPPPGMPVAPEKPVLVKPQKATRPEPAPAPGKSILPAARALRNLPKPPVKDHAGKKPAKADTRKQAAKTDKGKVKQADKKKTHTSPH